MADLYYPQRLEGCRAGGPAKTRWIMENNSGYSKLNQIVQPITAAVLKVVSLLETLVSGIQLLIWQMHSFHCPSKRRTEQFAFLWDE